MSRHSQCSCSLYDSRSGSGSPTSPHLSRKNSGGSGYQSNDSFSSPPGRYVKNGSTSCGSSCSSGSSRSSSVGPSTMRRTGSQHKILLVSAVDRKGNVVYRGASTSSLNKVGTNEGSTPEKGSVLSMKKSAEIAAVFSGAKINQTTDIVNHLGPDSDAYDTMTRRHQQSFSESNMHSSLGYFP